MTIRKERRLRVTQNMQTMTAAANKDLNRSATALPELCNYIDGSTSVPAIDRGNCLRNPNNQQEIQGQRSCSEQQVESALASAAAAFAAGEWESTPAEQRAKLLDEIAKLDQVDIVEAMARPYPFKIITRMLGIPIHDDDKFLVWALKIIDYPWDPEGALKAKQEFDDYMIPLIESRRAQPGDDVVSILVTATIEDETLNNEEILSFCRLLFPAGSDTTYKNMGSLLYAILSTPGMKKRVLLGDKEREAIVQEGLRWGAPTAMLPRMCSKDTELGGSKIKNGDWVLFGITAANNDPTVFDNPRQFDPDRDNKNLAFGHGVHFCLGSHLARRELETGIKMLFQRFPNMSLIEDRPVKITQAVIRGPQDIWVNPHGAGAMA